MASAPSRCSSSARNPAPAMMSCCRGRDGRKRPARAPPEARGRGGAGPPAGGLAASVPLSLLVSARTRWRQPCRTCGAPYPAPRRSEAPSCSSPSLAPRLVPGSSISAMKGESELATTFSVGNVGGGFRKYLTSENPWAEDGSRAPRRFPRPSELRPSHRVGPGSRLKEAAFRED